MATLIPALGACVSRMTGGERRLAERLEQKLDDDYLLWYDVPMGPHQSHPDFVVMHPRRGLLILEVKDWKPHTIRQADKLNWVILDHGQPKTVASPIEQARQYAHTVVDALKRDPQLVQADGKRRSSSACLVCATRHTRLPSCSVPRIWKATPGATWPSFAAINTPWVYAPRRWTIAGYHIRYVNALATSTPGRTPSPC
jgi:hypothetical protein